MKLLEGHIKWSTSTDVIWQEMRDRLPVNSDPMVDSESGEVCEVGIRRYVLPYLPTAGQLVTKVTNP